MVESAAVMSAPKIAVIGEIIVQDSLEGEGQTVVIQAKHLKKLDSPENAESLRQLLEEWELSSCYDFFFCVRFISFYNSFAFRSMHPSNVFL